MRYIVRFFSSATIIFCDREKGRFRFLTDGEIDSIQRYVDARREKLLELNGKKIIL
jgi:hypothetical protein